MRKIACLASLMLLAASLAGAGDREWLLQIGAGLCGADDLVFAGGGRSVTLGLATPARPWLLLGAEAAWQEFPARTGSTAWLAVYECDRSRVVAVTVDARIQLPVHSGLSPFAMIQTGAGRASVSEVRWIVEKSGTEPGRTGPIWITGAGCGVRLVPARDWPEFELGLRVGNWTSPTMPFESGHGVSNGQWRLACTF